MSDFRNSRCTGERALPGDLLYLRQPLPEMGLDTGHYVLMGQIGDDLVVLSRAVQEPPPPIPAPAPRAGGLVWRAAEVGVDRLATRDVLPRMLLVGCPRHYA